MDRIEVLGAGLRSLGVETEAKTSSTAYATALLDVNCRLVCWQF